MAFCGLHNMNMNPQFHHKRKEISNQFYITKLDGVSLLFNYRQYTLRIDQKQFKYTIHLTTQCHHQLK